MNLDKLMTIQADLDKHIEVKKGLQGQDLLDKKILALQVELGELANEWRGFKFWSNDQDPRTEYICGTCEGSEEISVETAVGSAEMGYDVYEVDVNCPVCEDVDDEKNPLLEEYVDCLHFILSIGLELKVDKENLDYEIEGNINTHKYDNLTVQFIWLGNTISNIFPYGERDYIMLLCEFISLGEMLGFTTEQIEQAYLDKNKVNHARQESNY